ncbi:MAG: hydrolase [Deltaproteobacteria bacterium RIFCSPLOWO2_02_FULL_53_8]|nr:MAG: hydrolase [Deltaproteobacteria bacterium RIFCSPLOWO2_02_FULL_53_8]
MTTGIKTNFLAAAASIAGRVCALSDEFYNNPETGLVEHKTSAAMQRMLAEAGYTIEPGVAGMETAFKAVLGSGRPSIALLAEMDALPGIGHGCGHNIAGMASIGAACGLAAVLPRPFTDGSIVVFGTPAEELGKGKIEMLSAGLFKDIDAAMMVHGSSRRTIVKHFLGLIRLNFTFTGRTSHASAYPEEGVNALDAVIQTFNAINALRQQMASDIRVHGIVTDGGRAPNIIPEKASAAFYVRAASLPALYQIRDRVVNCAKAAGIATGCSLLSEEEGEMNAPMKINMAFVDAYRGALAQLGLQEDGQSPDKHVGSSDIGNVSQAIPTIHPHIPVREGINIHTREFADATVSADGHRALMEGVNALGLTALECLFNPKTLQAIKDAFIKG